MNDHHASDFAPITVSELTGSIKTVLEESFRDVFVVGELSNVHRHGSGHVYFTLKDERAQLSAVMFRGNAASLFFRPVDGMEVICRGSLTVYEPRGNYQLVVREMHPRGEGALRAAFERVKRKLHSEGLFDEERKKPLPEYPQVVALVTSATGAAIKDMLSVIQRRNASVQLILVPVQVQGPGAAEDIALGVERCNRYGSIDIIIVGRGGGSIEDLWAFNEERVARAIANSRIPVVSAVGHEVDFTIADFVADLRAATPSVAGELVVPSLRETRQQLRDVSYTLRKFVDFRMEQARSHLSHLRMHRSLTRPADRLESTLQTLDQLTADIHHRSSLSVERATSSVEILRERFIAHDPTRIKKLGYTLIRSNEGIIHSKAELGTEKTLRVEFHDGEISVERIDPSIEP